jgi:hypothetical protein
MAKSTKTPAKVAKKAARKTAAKTHPAKKTNPAKQPAPVASTPSPHPSAGTPAKGPVYAEPTSSVDPTKYKTAHASDTQAYNEMDSLIKANKFLPLAFPTVPGVAEPILTLADALGSGGAAAVAAIESAGQIVFHSAGDTGATKGPGQEYTVADKMVSDFSGETAADVPQFFYNLGDIVYSFGEHQYYYDQFYDAYRNYAAPIFAIPGNHDGIVLPPGVPGDSLSAFLANFCTQGFQHSVDSGGLSRTTMIQPGVYFTLEAPLVRILGIYSNMLENPGVISSTPDPTKAGSPAKFPNIPDVQIDYLTTALNRVKTDKFEGAVIIAVHHPPYTYGGSIPPSMVMLKEIDAVCNATGVWPHAVLSGHAHNYQRYTRTIGGRQIPYVVVGCGGHGPLQKLNKGVTIRTPQAMAQFAQPEAKDSVSFDSYDDTDYGYCRILVDANQLRIEYHPSADGAATKTPDDSVTVQLTDGTLIHYVPPTA